MTEEAEPIGNEETSEAPAPAESAQLVQLKAEFADALISAVEEGSTLKIEATPEGLRALCETLRDRAEWRFDYPADLTAWDTGENFIVWYRLWSMTHKKTALVRVTLCREEPAVSSVASLWPGFDWFEREAYDLYGIRFVGHPDQDDPEKMRILLPEDWAGFPFRKDYEPIFEDNPLHGPQRTN